MGDEEPNYIMNKPFFNDFEILSFLNESKVPIVVKDDNFRMTLADVVNDIESLIRTENIMVDSGMGNDDKKWKSSLIRGDKICWIKPNQCKELNLKYLSDYIKYIMKTCQNLRTIKFLQQSLQLNGEYSVQLALYPGDGSGYVRHLDASNNESHPETSLTTDELSTEASESESDLTQTTLPPPPISSAQPTTIATTATLTAMNRITPNSTPPPRSQSSRRLTFILYLNSHWEGGQLRVFLPDSPQGHVDIDPVAGRVVVFRSDRVEHEVLPCFSPRLAVTIWAYGATTSPSLPTVSALQPSESQSSPGDPYPIPLPVFVHKPDIQTVDTQRLRQKDYNLQDEVRSTLHVEPTPLDIPEYPDVLDTVTIFVCIASFRDTELFHTLSHMFATAKHPARLSVGLVWQGDLPGDVATLPYPPDDVPEWAAQLHVLSLPSAAASGPCWARHLCQSLWRGEEMVLQIDSHMRFRRGWDAYLLAVWSQLREDRGVCQPVLTTYPLPYTLPNRVIDDVRPTVLVPTKFDDDGILRQSGRYYNAPPCKNNTANDAPHNAATSSPFCEPIPSPLWAAGFSFASSAVLSVPYDPLLQQLFFGEEISMAARLYTSGFDLYAPGQAVVYHLWSRTHRPPLPPRSVSAQSQRERSLYRVRRMLGVGPVPIGAGEGMSECSNCSSNNSVYGSNCSEHNSGGVSGGQGVERGGMGLELELAFGSGVDVSAAVGGRYGLGTVRTLKQFETHVGVDFAGRVVHESARSKHLLDIDSLVAALDCTTPTPTTEHVMTQHTVSDSHLGVVADERSSLGASRGKATAGHSKSGSGSGSTDSTRPRPQPQVDNLAVLRLVTDFLKPS